MILTTRSVAGSAKVRAKGQILAFSALIFGGELLKTPRIFPYPRLLRSSLLEFPAEHDYFAHDVQDCGLINLVPAHQPYEEK